MRASACTQKQINKKIVCGVNFNKMSYKKYYYILLLCCHTITWLFSLCVTNNLHWYLIFHCAIEQSVRAYRSRSVKGILTYVVVVVVVSHYFLLNFIHLQIYMHGHWNGRQKTQMERNSVKISCYRSISFQIWNSKAYIEAVINL